MEDIMASSLVVLVHDHARRLQNYLFKSSTYEAAHCSTVHTTGEIQLQVSLNFIPRVAVCQQEVAAEVVEVRVPIPSRGLAMRRRRPAPGELGIQSIILIPSAFCFGLFEIRAVLGAVRKGQAQHLPFVEGVDMRPCLDSLELSLHIQVARDSNRVKADSNRIECVCLEGLASKESNKGRGHDIV